MAKNEIIVLPAHDYENVVEGGYNALHMVVSCDIDDDKGVLTWDRVMLPSPIVVQSDHPTTTNVKNMRVVGEDVLQLLKGRGVKVIIQKEGAAAPVS